jgi:DNA ligase-1
MKTLPTLYKRASTGKIQEWTIGVEGSTIITVHGQTDGKKQRTEDVIKEGKNIGRSNETSSVEQALAEATSKWEGKIKKGYVEDVTRAGAGEKDIAGGYDCMLAHKFADHGHKIKYPAFEQPKLNGHRCLAIIEDGTCTLWSRTRKPITSSPHIIEELQKVFPIGLHKVDGELYNHDYKDKFEELASLIRQEVPAPNHTEIQYHVYDYLIEGKGFADRIEHLYTSLHCYEKANALLKCVKFVETVRIKDEADMISTFEHFLELGYEGGMARNASGHYAGKRSYDLQKIKEFQDDEFTIVGINEGRGGYSGCGIFVCKAKSSSHPVTCMCKECTFDVKMRGPKEQLKKFWSDHSTWKGRMLTVKYQYVSAYGIPIFPVGERFA